MTFRNRLNDLTVTMRVGLVFMILAGVWRLFLHPSADFSAGFIEGATALLYGVSIVCLLLGLWKRRCARGGGTGPTKPSQS